MAEKRPKFIYNATTVTLDYPMATNDYYEIKTIRTDSFSISGVRQTSFDRNDEIKDIDIQFASSSTALALRTMYSSWACEGKSLDFYPDKDVASFDTVTIVENTFAVIRQQDGTNIFKVRFKIRKDV